MSKTRHLSSPVFFENIDIESAAPVLIQTLSELAPKIADEKSRANGIFLLRPSSDKSRPVFSATIVGKTPCFDIESKSSSEESAGCFHCRFAYQDDNSILLEDAPASIKTSKDLKFRDLEHLIDYLKIRGYMPVLNASADLTKFPGIKLSSELYKKIQSNDVVIADATSASTAVVESKENKDIAYFWQLIGYYRKYQQCLNMDIEKWKAGLAEKKKTLADVVVRPYVPKEQRTFPEFKLTSVMDTQDNTSMRGATQVDLNYWRSFYDNVERIEFMLGKEPGEIQKEIWNLEQTTMFFCNQHSGRSIKDINECRLQEPSTAISEEYLLAEPLPALARPVAVAFDGRYKVRATLSSQSQAQLQEAVKKLPTEWKVNLDKDIENVLARGITKAQVEKFVVKSGAGAGTVSDNDNSMFSVRSATSGAGPAGAPAPAFRYKKS